MITASILEPIIATPGDYWYNIGDRNTYCLMPNYQWCDFTVILQTSSFAPVALAGIVVIGPNDPDNIPHQWDANMQRWEPIVPKNYNFPKLSPTVGDLWTDHVDLYTYTSSGWRVVTPGLLPAQVQSNVPAIWQPPVGINRGLVLDMEDETDEEQDKVNAYDRAMRGIGK